MDSERIINFDLSAFKCISFVQIYWDTNRKKHWSNSAFCATIVKLLAKNIPGRRHFVQCIACVDFYLAERSNRHECYGAYDVFSN